MLWFYRIVLTIRRFGFFKRGKAFYMHLFKNHSSGIGSFLIHLTCLFVWAAPTYGGEKHTDAPPAQPSLKDSLLNAGSSLLEKVGKEWDKVEEKVGNQIDKVGENIKKAFPREMEQASPSTTSPSPDTINRSLQASPELSPKKSPSERDDGPPTKIQNFLHGIAMEQLDLSDIVDQASAAIVNIHVKYNRLYTHPFFNDPFLRTFFGHNLPAQRVQEQAIGSGTIVRKDGIVLTCAHVVDGGDSITVQLHDGRRFPARVIFTNKKEDIAFLKIDTTADDKNRPDDFETAPLEFPTLSIAETEEPKVGRFILAVGYPQGQRLVTFGMISSLGEISLIESSLRQDYVITVTAEMGPGMSGGALLNLKGELLGIPNAIILQELTKHSIAIPVRVALKYLRTMDENGTIQQPWHGIDVKPVVTSLEKSPSSRHKSIKGNMMPSDHDMVLMITHVTTESPAAKAGLKEGDIIESINGKVLKNFNSFKQIIAVAGVGEKMTLDIKRGDTKITATYTIASMSPDILSNNHVLLTKGFLKGITIRMQQDNQSAEIMEISPSSPAISLGIELEKGDIIRTLNKNPIRSPHDFEDVEASRFSMDIQRNNQTFSMMMNMGPSSKQWTQKIF